jgi:hypothetical protein
MNESESQESLEDDLMQDGFPPLPPDALVWGLRDRIRSARVEAEGCAAAAQKNPKAHKDNPPRGRTSKSIFRTRASQPDGHVTPPTAPPLSDPPRMKKPKRATQRSAKKGGGPLRFG